MTEEEKKEVSKAIDWLDILFDDIEEYWDPTEPVPKEDYIKLRQMLTNAYDILIELKNGRTKQERN